MRYVLALVALIATPVAAQTRPVPGPGDPRIQSVTYDADQVVLLEVASGYQLTVEFAPGERIENVAIGDSGAWQVTPNKRGDRLFIKPLEGGTGTDLTVVTDARNYVFDLATGPGESPAYIVRFRYPPLSSETLPGAKAGAVVGRYKLSGAKAIRPDAISDDGAATYIMWRADQVLPAVFVVDRGGKEGLAGGTMRDGRYVIDSIADRLIFRLDGQTAGAQRVPRVAR